MQLPYGEGQMIQQPYQADQQGQLPTLEQLREMIPQQLTEQQAQEVVAQAKDIRDLAQKALTEGGQQVEPNLPPEGVGLQTQALGAQRHVQRFGGGGHVGGGGRFGGGGGIGRGFGQPGLGRGFGQPGFGRNIGQPGLGRNIGQPGFGRNIGQPGFGRNIGQPGFGRNIGQPGFGRNIGQPGLGRNIGRPGLGRPGVRPFRGPTRNWGAERMNRFRFHHQFFRNFRFHDFFRHHRFFHYFNFDDFYYVPNFTSFFDAFYLQNMFYYPLVYDGLPYYVEYCPTGSGVLVPCQVLPYSSFIASYGGGPLPL